MAVRLEDEVRCENNLGADVQLRQGRRRSRYRSSALWTFHPRLAGNRRAASFHPTSVMVSGFDIIFF
ncbi:hypothetical protein KCP73_09045 [Salmonella enterica subsp. enterica]|nr:hypothetical protein KCP73_09045 [Salmonella enterica subsp. enterica]